MSELPSGTVTFLFTDLVSSTRLWEEQPDEMQRALARHDAVIRDAIETHRGHVVKTRGDGFHAAFSTARDAIDAAVAAQLALAAEPWGVTGPLLARIGIHTGEAQYRDGDYYGTALNRAARIMSVANGGQVLVSRATEELVRDLLPEGAALVDLGEHRLRDLSRPERVYQICAPGLADEFPAVRTIGGLLGNLPMPRDRFIGRARELAEVAAALEEFPLVTLTGVGGVGKTRLAVQLAVDAITDYRDGAWLVELAGVGNEELFDDGVAAVLGVEQRQGATMRQSLLDHLRDKQLVLVLDNCEHLVARAASFVEEALAVAPRLKMLATSREGLGISGERVFAVPVLALPGADADRDTLLASDAVQLFLARAGEATGGTSTSDEQLHDVAVLCRRLDGIPLAIELAAARRRSMTPAEIAAHLDRRFRMLTGGRRTAVSRHQTMRNAVDWSYELLDDDERVLLHRLSLFAGSFDLAAAQALAAGADLDVLDVIDVLSRLVDKSLVVAEPGETQTRYRLLETIRDYAWERLEESGDAEAPARRHAEYFVSFAEDAGVGLRGPDEPEWVDRVEVELDNLQTALRWAINAGETDLALRCVAALTISASAVGNPFGALAEEAAAMPGASDHVLRPIALASASFSARLAGPERAIALGEAAVAAASRLPGDLDRLVARCTALGALCSALSSWSVNADRTMEISEELVVEARRLGDPYLLTEALNLRSWRAPEGVITASEEALQCARQTGNPSRLAFSLLLLARVVSHTDAKRARRCLEEAAAYALSVRHQYATDFAMQSLSIVQAAEGDYRAASETLVAAAERAIWAGDRNSRNIVLRSLSLVLAVLHADEPALILGAWADQQGIEFDATSYSTVGLSVAVDAYARVLAQASSSELAEAGRRAEGMADRDLVALARAAISR